MIVGAVIIGVNYSKSYFNNPFQTPKQADNLLR